MTEQKQNNQAKQSERADRIVKLDKIKQAGIKPYPAISNRTHQVEEAMSDFDKLERAETEIVLTGRLRSMREHGNIAFADLEDASGKIQLVWSKKEIGDSYKQFIKLIDVSDFVEVKGVCFVTKAGERSLMVKSWRLLTKALRGLPDEHYGLKNEEERLRKRYLDILMNPEVKDMIIRKDKFWNATRKFLKDRGFIEVETPVLENTPGGADARPFVTHHNALDIDVYLRISMGELWQKKLMVAGLEKTFEIGRQFRNEGMDAEHLQDYTQMEFYWAYADYQKGMKLVEEMYKYMAAEAFDTLQFQIGNFHVDLDKEWEIYDYQKTVLKYTGVDILEAKLEEMEAKLRELGVEYDTEGFNITRAIDNLWKYCRKKIGGPGFLVGVPVTVSPLAKRDDNNPEIAQRFQVIIAGSEIGNGYSELNDPIDQAGRFEEQQALREAGDDEAQRKDEDFVEALEYGMPPTCGFGVSERLFWFLINKPARECQIFPLMRPKHESNDKKDKDSNNKNNKDDKENKGENLTNNNSNIKFVEPVAVASDDELAESANQVISKQGLGIDYQKAQQVLRIHVQDSHTLLHSRETEVIMRALAKYLGENEEEWGIIGLLHDIDWDLTKNNPSQHCIKAVEILKGAGGSQFLVNSVISHCYGHQAIPVYSDKQRSTKLEHCLAAAETLTGLIVATALVRPDKQLANVELKSLKKKYQTLNFAANCDRGTIIECEQAGIELDTFLQIGLDALKAIANELDL